MVGSCGTRRPASASAAAAAAATTTSSEEEGAEEGGESAVGEDHFEWYDKTPRSWYDGHYEVGVLPCSPLYMAPEATIHYASNPFAFDTYALGVILAQLALHPSMDSNDSLERYDYKYLPLCCSSLSLSLSLSLSFSLRSNPPPCFAPLCHPRMISLFQNPCVSHKGGPHSCERPTTTSTAGCRPG